MMMRMMMIRRRRSTTTRRSRRMAIKYIVLLMVIIINAYADDVEHKCDPEYARLFAVLSKVTCFQLASVHCGEATWK
jgi:hypothetical protein